MKYAGVTVFVLFFGVSLVEAIGNGEWRRAALWLAAGIVFWALEQYGLRRDRRP